MNQPKDNFAPDNVDRRIRRAMNPQLRQLRNLQLAQERGANLERLRRRYDMFDATDDEVRANATRTAFRGVVRQVAAVVDSIGAGFAAFGKTMAEAQQRTRADYVITPPPVPADHHASKATQ